MGKTRWGVVIAVFLLVFVSVVLPPAMAADTYEVDPVHSSIVFRIKHLGLTFVLGRFNDFTGVLRLDEKDPAKNSLEMTAQAASIDTNSQKRDEHLKSADFFDVKQYPVITFKSRSFKLTDEDLFEVEGDLSLHGVTRPLTVEIEKVGSAKDPWGGFRMGFESEFMVRRSDYQMKHMLDLVADEAYLEVSIQAVRK